MATAHAQAQAEEAPKKPTNPPPPKSEKGAPVEEPIDYKLTNSDVVIRTKDGIHIPNDPNNPDRVQYEAWGMAGGVAMPADPPPAPPPIQPEPDPEPAPKKATTTVSRSKEY